MVVGKITQVVDVDFPSGQLPELRGSFSGSTPSILVERHDLVLDAAQRLDESAVRPPAGGIDAVKARASKKAA